VRQRSLWLEFDQPPQDPDDAYFVRVTNYGPDPLLMSDPVDITPAPDAPIALDPEPIRTITPDSVNDAAGLSAMTQVQPSASSSVHFLVPLPDGISPDALDLFGFWSYEIRVGHLLWSTAQGRFGRPFTVRGVQHPCRTLIATVDRNVAIPTDGGAAQPCIVASADLAQTVLDGESLTSAASPQTQIWFLLYAQLRRVDGEAYRNILLMKLLGQQPNIAGTGPGFNNPISGQIVPHDTPSTAGIAQIQSIPVQAAFSVAEVNTFLTDLLLPINTPLSVLAVELFNLESLVIREPAGGGGPAPKLEAATTSGSASSSGTATAVAAPRATTFAQSDPLGDALGSQRILRVSLLTPVSPVC
jgi:hypothetical protein